MLFILPDSNSSGIKPGALHIDFIVTATTTSGEPQQVAAADCQRMVWQEDRWVIGEGDEPAPAPSLWPGSQASFDAGYQWLEVAQS